MTAKMSARERESTPVDIEACMITIHVIMETRQQAVDCLNGVTERPRTVSLLNLFSYNTE